MTRRGGSRGGHSPGRGGLSQEDADLWSRTAQSLKPLRRAKARVSTGRVDEPAPHRQPQAKAVRASDRTAIAAKPRTQPTPPLARFDQRKLRGLARGQIEIEARIDLHGLRQTEAYRRLRAFVLDAHARGLRSVLVITGKGARSSEADWSDPSASRGIIRRNVPLWLEEPELRSVVVSFTEAHPRHGGEGAFYVHLRRRQVSR